MISESIWYDKKFLCPLYVGSPEGCSGKQVMGMFDGICNYIVCPIVYWINIEEEVKNEVKKEEVIKTFNTLIFPSFEKYGGYTEEQLSEPPEMTDYVNLTFNKISYFYDKLMVFKEVLEKLIKY